MENVVNKPDFADYHKYMVIRPNKYKAGTFWFFGAYDNKGKAEAAAKYVKGRVLCNEAPKRKKW
jgi:hypothetical protein